MLVSILPSIIVNLTIIREDGIRIVMHTFKVPIFSSIDANFKDVRGGWRT